MHWNLFKVFIFIVRRINFSVEFVPKDKIRCEHEQRFASLQKETEVSEWQEELKLRHDGSLAIGDNYYPIDLISARRPFQPAGHLGARRLKAARCGSNLSEGRLLGRPGSGRMRSDSISSCLSSVYSQLSKYGTKLNNLHYSYLHLSFFTFNLLVSILITTKLVLNSTIWSCKIVHNRFNSTVVLSSSSCSNNVSSRRLTKLVSLMPEDNQTVWWFLGDLLFNDCFANFTNGPTINLIGATLLFPGTSTRLLKLLQLIYNVISSTSSTKETKSEASSNDYVSNQLAQSEPVNVVQLNLSYMNILYASTSDWIRLTKESWFHKHSISDSSKETSIINRISAIEGSIPSRIDFKTRMYFYNLIDFNDCYTKYFQNIGNNRIIIDVEEKKPNPLERPEVKSGHENVDTRRILSRIKMETTPRDLPILADGNRKLHDFIFAPEKVNIKNVFVARPIHRLDLNEMGWLVLMLLVAYVLAPLSIVVPIFCALMVEMNIANANQLFDSTLVASNLLKLVTSQGILRFLFISIWQVLIILSVFDLFNYFASSLICFSRARYLKLHLERINELCILIRKSKIFGDETFCGLLEDTSGKARTLFRRESRIIDINLNGQQLCSNRNLTGLFPSGSKTVESILVHRPLPLDSSMSPARGQICDKSENNNRNLNRHDLEVFMGKARYINEQIEFMIDLGVIIQRELADIKKFFTSYLNLEITFKVSCLALLVTTFLDYKSIFEWTFLIIITNLAVTPILIVLVMASFIEREFRAICRTETRVIVNGSGVIKMKNIRRIIQQADYLSNKSNRSFVVIGNFCLTLGSLVPVIGWIATGVVLLRR